MRREFERYGLSKYRVLTGVSQFLGAFALMMGSRWPVLGLLASGGFAAQMLLAVAVRFRIGDSIAQALPATVYLLLNVWLAWGFARAL